MTSYGSYNEIKKPIIADSVIISISNCSFSFISGFAVWLVVGYLDKIGKLDENKVVGASLAFITYPTAIDTMKDSNVWAILLGLTLFMLGIDSSFSAIEATSTVICDTAWKGKAPRMFIAFVLCVCGFLGSFPFCFNWGFVLFDVVDHYLCAYLLQIIGILQAIGCGWFFDAANNMAKSPGHRRSILLLGFSYWSLLIIILTPSICVDRGHIGFYVFVFCEICCLCLAFAISGLNFSTWYTECMMCGVHRISYACSQMTRKGRGRLWWEPFFAFYWGILIKYVNPCLLYIFLISITKTDIETPYEGYGPSWQYVGWAIPIVGFILFGVATVFFASADTRLNYDEFILEEEKIDGKATVQLGPVKMSADTDVGENI